MVEHSTTYPEIEGLNPAIVQYGRHDTQHSDNQHKDIQQNNTQHTCIQHNNE